MEEEQLSMDVSIPDRLFFRIGEVSEIVGVKPYVLRYWESEFPFLSPDKAQNGQRVYRKNDVETLLLIKHLLYQERYSIEGARKRMNELRKKGEYRSFKKQKVQEKEKTSLDSEHFKGLKRKVEDLQHSINKPIHELFRL